MKPHPVATTPAEAAYLAAVVAHEKDLCRYSKATLVNALAQLRAGGHPDGVAAGMPARELDIQETRIVARMRTTSLALARVTQQRQELMKRGAKS